MRSYCIRVQKQEKAISGNGKTTVISSIQLAIHF